MESNPNELLGTAAGVRDLLGRGALISALAHSASLESMPSLRLATSAISDLHLSISRNAIADLTQTDRFLGLSASIASLGDMRELQTTLASASALALYPSTLAAFASVTRVADTLLKDTNIASITASIRNLAPAGQLSAWTRDLGETCRELADITSPYAASLSAAYSVESSFARIASSAASLQLQVKPELATLDLLGKNLASLSLATGRAWEGLSANTAILSSLPSFVLRSPAVELYTSARLIGAVTLDSEEEEQGDPEIEEFLSAEDERFERRLAVLDPGLAETYRGAIVAIERGGPDWRRHAMVSLREMSIHVLHRLSPDDQVRVWDPAAETHERRFTQRARMRFIFARAGTQMTDFFDTDLNTALDLFRILNGGTHKLGNQATPGQLHALKNRVVGLISSMLSARDY